MSSDLHIRPATADDRDAFYEICVRTSDNGNDGWHLHEDKDALGNIYVGPYLEFESKLALALEDEQGVCGYCLATGDSASFYTQFTNDWLPPVQRTLTAPTGPSSEWTTTQQIHHLLLNPGDLVYFPEAFRPWPGHIHVDLLPRAQSRGMGRKLMTRQLQALRDNGASGVHLSVAPGNTRALAFYNKLGFTPLPMPNAWPEDTVYIGKKLN